MAPFVDVPFWHQCVLSGLSLTVCTLIILFARRVPRLSGRSNQLQAVQAMHVRPTSRLGGVGMFAALIASLWLVPEPMGGAYQGFLLATSFLFLVGLAEDLGFGVAPLWRLATILLTSLVVIAASGVWLPRADLPGLDALMGHWVVGIPLTLLVTAGIANGFNLIDGVNGLAAVTGISGAIALGLVAKGAGYDGIVPLTAMLAASVLGFLVLNYPFGRIFLGDAGAYTLGFVLSWFAIDILVNAPTASPWAMLLILLWPVADTILAIWRRTHRKAPTMAPDRLHFHQLVMRALEVHLLGRGRRHIANPLTTLILAPCIIAPQIAGVLLWDDPLGAFAAVVVFLGCFFGSYRLAFVVIDRLPRRPAKVMRLTGSGAGAAARSASNPAVVVMDGQVKVLHAAE